MLFWVFDTMAINAYFAFQGPSFGRCSSRYSIRCLSRLLGPLTWRMALWEFDTMVTNAFLISQNSSYGAQAVRTAGFLWTCSSKDQQNPTT